MELHYICVLCLFLIVCLCFCLFIFMLASGAFHSFSYILFSFYNKSYYLNGIILSCKTRNVTSIWSAQRPMEINPFFCFVEIIIIFQKMDISPLASEWLIYRIPREKYCFLLCFISFSLSKIFSIFNEFASRSSKKLIFYIILYNTIEKKFIFFHLKWNINFESNRLINCL